MASDRRSISDCVNEFTLSMYRHMAYSEPASNVFLSPSNIAIVMMLVYLGAKNDTEDQMVKVLKLDKMDRSRVPRQMEKFIHRLKKDNESVTFKIANKLFPHSDKRILEDYLSLVSKYFDASVKQLDFTNELEESRKEINTWVEEETNATIKDILPEGSLPPNTAMVVVNTVYFKGNWHTPFDNKRTETRTFVKLNSDNIKVEMMRNKRMEDAYYGKDRRLDCKVLKLPYEGRGIGLIVVLPNTDDGLPGLEEQLDIKVLRGLVKIPRLVTADVSLPKFKLESSIKLKEVLSMLGMVDAFDEDKADLSRMGDDLYVSEVYHKTFIDVNEEGTEAGAATAAVEVSRCLEETYRFNADHAFLFMIWHEKLEVPLFIGRLVEPVVASTSNTKKTRHYSSSGPSIKKRKVIV